MRPPPSPGDSLGGARDPSGNAAAGPPTGLSGAAAQASRWTGADDDERWEEMDTASNASFGSAGAYMFL